MYHFPFLLIPIYSSLITVFVFLARINKSIGHFTVVCLVAKPLIWSEAEGDLVVIETSI